MATPELETWKNDTAARIWVKKVDRHGELEDVQVPPGKVLHLTPDERRINHEIAVEEKFDMFKNGSLTPVRLIEGTEDAAEIASNPNLMSETDMRDLFKQNWRTFDAKVQEITNPIALDRLREIASEEDATVRQMEVITNRLAEFGHVVSGSEVDQVGDVRAAVPPGAQSQ